MDKILSLFNLQTSNFKTRLGVFWGLAHVRLYLIIAIVVNGVLWLLAWLIVRNIDQATAILHYNILFGIDYIGQPHLIYVVPGLGLVWLIVNTVISFFTFKKDKFLSHLLLGFVEVGHLFLGLALYAIYLINFVNITL